MKADMCNQDCTKRLLKRNSVDDPTRGKGLNPSEDHHETDETMSRGRLRPHCDRALGIILYLWEITTKWPRDAQIQRQELTVSNESEFNRVANLHKAFDWWFQKAQFVGASTLKGKSNFIGSEISVDSPIGVLFSWQRMMKNDGHMFKICIEHQEACWKSLSRLYHHRFRNIFDQ